MAGYYNSHPQYGGSSYQHHQSPPQQSPPTMAYSAYSPPATYNYQHQYPGAAHAPSAFQLEPQTPILDQDQLNYFWKEVNSGHIPSNLPGTSQTQTFFAPPAAQPYQSYGVQQQTHHQPYQYSQLGPQQSPAPPPAIDPYLHHRPLAHPGVSIDTSIPELQREPEIVGDLEEEEYAPPDISLHSAEVGSASALDSGLKAKGKSSFPPSASQATPNPTRINLFKPLSHYDKIPSPLTHKDDQTMKSLPLQTPKIGLKRKACDAIKDFHRHGIGFSQLEKEPSFDESDKRILRELYTLSSIPLDSAPKETMTIDDSGERLARLREMLGSAGFNDIDEETLAKLAQAGVKTQAGPATQAGASIPGLSLVGNDQKPKTPPRAAIRATPAADTVVLDVATKEVANAGRDSYLAKLRAMKSKNLPEAAAPVPPAEAALSPKLINKPSPNSVHLPGISNPTPRKPLQINRDIMQKKMQALRAAQARQAASVVTASELTQPAERAGSVSSVNYDSRASARSVSDAERTQEEGLAGAGEDLEEGEVSETAATKTPKTAVQPKSVQSEVVQPAPKPVVPQTPQKTDLPAGSTSDQQPQSGVSLKRSARSAFGIQRTGPLKRSYPPRRFQEAPEPLVIDITSDEDSDESDGDEAEGAPTKAQLPAHSMTARRPPAAFNTDQYHSPSSALSTPQESVIPDPIAAEQAKRKAELALKRAELQRRIQLQEKRKLEITNSSPRAADGPSAAPFSGSPATRTVSGLSPALSTTGNAANTRGVLTPSQTCVTATSVDQQTAFTAIDNSIRSDQDELSVLQEQVRRIQENIARKEAEKQALAAELASMGVDSEGMSVSRMQQIRDDLVEQPEEAQAAAKPATEENEDAEVNTDSEVADDEATPIERRPTAVSCLVSSNEESDGDSGEDGEILEDSSNPPDAHDAAHTEQPIARTTPERRDAMASPVKTGAHSTPMASAQQKSQIQDVPSPCLTINEDARARGFCLQVVNIDPDVDRVTLRKWLKGLAVVGLLHDRPSKGPKGKSAIPKPSSAVIEFASMEEALRVLPELQSRKCRNTMLQVTHLAPRGTRPAPIADSPLTMPATVRAQAGAGQVASANSQNNVPDSASREDSSIGEADDARALASSARVKISGVPRNASKQDVRKFLIDFAITGITLTSVSHPSAALAERDVLVDFLYPGEAENASQQMSNAYLLGKRVQVSVITPTSQDVAAAAVSQRLELASDGPDDETSQSEETDDDQDFEAGQRRFYPPVAEPAVEVHRPTEVIPATGGSADATSGHISKPSTDGDSVDEGDVTEDQASRFLEQQEAAIENTSDDDSSEEEADGFEPESATERHDLAEAGVLLQEPEAVDSGEEYPVAQEDSESGPSEAPERSDDEDGMNEDPAAEPVLQTDTDGSEEEYVDSESGDTYEPLDAVFPQNSANVSCEVERTTSDPDTPALGAGPSLTERASRSACVTTTQTEKEEDDEDDDLYEPDEAPKTGKLIADRVLLDGVGEEDDYDPEFEVAIHEAFADAEESSRVGDTAEAVREPPEPTQPDRTMSGGIPGLGSDTMEISEGEIVSEAEPQLSGPADVSSKSVVPLHADHPIGAEPYNTTSPKPASDVRNSDSLTISQGKADPATRPLPHLGFVPYESPLKCFKAYKYSPAFKQTVNGRFTSLTYSNKINPNQPLCTTDLHSGECTNPQCPLQHFRDMMLTVRMTADGEMQAGQDVIRLIGTLDETNSSKDDKQRWAAGIRDIIDELRKGGINDIETIAERVVAYRRSFFGGSILNMIVPAQKPDPSESPSEGEISE